MDFFPLRPPAPPTMEADGGARLRRALTSLVGSGLDGVSPHPIHGKGQGEGQEQSLRHAGGIMEARMIAGMAEAYYAAIAPHNPLGPISLAAGLQLAASIPNFLCQEQVTLGDGYLKQPFKVEKGYVRIPEGPGLGIELDENQIANKLDHDWRNRETYDLNDGSVVDW